jgi:hypothetical protein
VTTTETLSQLRRPDAECGLGEGTKRGVLIRGADLSAQPEQPRRAADRIATDARNSWVDVRATLPTRICPEGAFPPAPFARRTHIG